MAFSLTGDLGCESGGGVNCTTNKKDAAGNIIAYKQAFLGFMLYNRWWLHKDRYAFTLGGGKINNPGRYLVLLPPINGATATTGTPYLPRRIPVISSRRGTSAEPTITCRANTSRSAGNSITVTPTCRTGAGRVE